MQKLRRDLVDIIFSNWDPGVVKIEGPVVKKSLNDQILL